ncbi:MAG TPA: hypothetical protein VE291_02735 [Terracidiphilus sp.]|jgi:Zn-dependent protease|nr:hypothetical protein [Terracidiphilus sp.]
MLTLAWFYPFFQGLFFGVLAMLLHESGHIGAALALRVRVKTVGFRWMGIYTVREAGSTVQNLIISFAGPLTNLILLLLWPLSKEFFLANVCYALVNLLPIQGSDGDRILRLWQERKREKEANKDASATLRQAAHVTELPQTGD